MSFKISDLPPAELPLSGNELIEVTQGGNSRSIAVQDIAAVGVGIDDTLVDGSGHLIVTYTNGATQDAGKVTGEPGNDGRSIASVAINGAKHLIVTYSDGTTSDAGEVPPGTNNVTMTGTTKNEFLNAGNGSWNANSIAGDPPHWLEVTNDPGNDTSSGNQLLRINSYGALGFGGNFHFCRYRGTEAAPTAIKGGDFLQSFGYRGWTGSALSGSAAAFQVVANEDWTASANGIRFQFQNVPDGGASRTTSLTIDGNKIVSQRPLGIGVTPSTWNANYRTIEIGSVGCGVRGHISAPEVTLHSNLYFDTGFKYGSGASSPGGLYQISGGAHVWSGAPAGAAGAAATVTEIARLTNVTGTGYNAAVSALKVNKDATTNRSINAAGTVNASGADYAEYMRKAEGCGEVAKGQIVGINSQGQITDKWAESIAFMVKSTDPSYVGGDVWGRAEVVGEYPAQPGPDADDGELIAYTGALADFELRLDAERAKYDRIAFAGQVPVNVQGATPGDYIVPVMDGDSVSGEAVSNPSFEQYRAAVGRVIAVGDDGRALVIVKVA